MDNDNANGGPVEPSNTDALLLGPLVEAGYELIPLKRGQKVPKDKNWTRKLYKNSDQTNHMERGGNVGVRLRAGDLVIDVDPRNFGDGWKDVDPFSEFVLSQGLDPTSWPRVATGGGGSHYFLTKPNDISVVDSLRDFPGVEFKTLGRQVVAPGSVHPETGKLYRWDGLDDDPSAAPPAPTSLIDAISRSKAPSLATASGTHSPEEIAVMLAALNPEDFADHEAWFEVMCACHHASGGGAKAEFIEWSAGDPVYADHAGRNSSRWDSLNAEGGGPKVTVRTLYKLLCDAGREDAIPRISAEDDFDDDPISPSPFEDWVWVADASRFIRRSDLKKYRPEQWKSMYANLKPDGDILNAVWKGNVPIKKFEGLVYLPEAPEILGGERYNLWRPSGVEAREGDVSWFEDHMEFMFPDQIQRDLVLDYLATMVQRPAEKIHFALLVHGDQGSGKSAIGEIMRRIIGDRNVVKPSNDEVMNKYTVWQEGAQLAIMEELMMVGRLDLMNRLKPVITEPTLRIEEKYGTPYSIPNHLNLLGFTNHRDALKVENGDRRWLVVFSPAKPREPAYYDQLFAKIGTDGGSAAIKYWLLQRQVSLNPKGRAPQTVAKEDMRRLSMGEAESWLLEAYEMGVAPFDFDLVRTENLMAELPIEMRRRHKNLKAIASKFLQDEIGAIQHSRYTKGDGRPAIRLWSIRNHDLWQERGASERVDAYIKHWSFDDRVDDA